MFSLTSRSAKTWRRRSKRRIACRSAIIQGTFSNQPEVSTTSGSKVMAHYVKFTKVVTLTLTLIRFWPRNFARVLRVESICCQNFRKIGPVLWPVERSRTDKHTNNQTDRQTVVTNILCKNLRFCKVMKGHSESAYFAKLVLQTEWFTLLWQRSRTQSIGPNDSNERCVEYYLGYYK